MITALETFPVRISNSVGVSTKFHIIPQKGKKNPVRISKDEVKEEQKAVGNLDRNYCRNGQTRLHKRWPETTVKHALYGIKLQTLQTQTVVFVVVAAAVVFGASHLLFTVS